MKSITKILSSAVSTLFSPLLIPSYVGVLVLWGSYLAVTALKARLMVMAAIFGLTCLLPLIVICFLKAIRVVESTGLNERRERPIPYAVAMVGYMALWVYLGRIHAPGWFSAFYLASAIAAMINFIVNFRWKISGHATAAGGLLAFTFFMLWRMTSFSDSPIWFLLAVMIAAMVSSARLALERHTVMQVVAGLITGIACVTVTQLLS